MQEYYTINMFRIPDGRVRVEFVINLAEGRGKKVQHTISLEDVKSKVQLEAFANIWMLTGKVPMDALVLG